MRGIIVWILLFFSLVLIHEFGHFIAAKKSGVKVLEFGIGIPPKLFKIHKDRDGTEYTINLLPLWGFCRLKGEDPNKPEEFHARDSFISAKLWKKIIILLAGVFMNFMAAWVIFTTVFTLGTEPISILPENAIDIKSTSLLMPTFSYLQKEWFIDDIKLKSPALIANVYEDSLAYELWIQSGDIITSINDDEINARTIGITLKKYIGSEFDVSYTRWEEDITKTTTCPEDNCLLWVTIASDLSLEWLEIKYPLWTAALMWLKEIWAQTRLTMSALGKLGGSLISFDKTRIKWSLNRLTWPAGAVKFGERLLELGGWKAFLAFGGMISLALAIFNILPIPALDGGRLIWVLIQGIWRLKAEKYFTIESYINIIFFVFLLGFWVYVFLNDLSRLWWVNIPFM